MSIFLTSILSLVMISFPSTKIETETNFKLLENIKSVANFGGICPTFGSLPNILGVWSMGGCPNILGDWPRNWNFGQYYRNLHNILAIWPDIGTLDNIWKFANILGM